MTMIFFFFHIQSSSFQGFEDQPLFQRQNFIPETFANLIVAFLNCFSSDVVFDFFFPVSACVLTQSCILPVTHAAKHTQLIRPFSRTCDTRSRTPGPTHQGERMVPCWGVSLEEMNLAPQH